MTNDEMRLAIAEACGREADYMNDLNAMHEAEKTLTDEQWRSYRNHLQDLAWKAVKDLNPLPQWTRMEGCTAAQRAEAFCRVKGLYRDD